MLKSEYLEKDVGEYLDDSSDDGPDFDLASLGDYITYSKRFKKGRIKEIYVAS